MATIVALGMVFVDGTIVNVAIRGIGEELSGTLVGTLEAQAYITSGYLAILAALLILAGALADKYGRRRIFTVALWGFGLTSVLCGIAPSMENLSSPGWSRVRRVRCWSRARFRSTRSRPPRCDSVAHDDTIAGLLLSSRQVASTFDPRPDRLTR